MRQFGPPNSPPPTIFHQNQQLSTSLTACTHTRIYGPKMENHSGFILQESEDK